MDEKPEKLLLRYEEAAKISGLGKTTIIALVRDGVLPVVRIARRCVRIPSAALRQWVETGARFETRA